MYDGLFVDYDVDNITTALKMLDVSKRLNVSAIH